MAALKMEICFVLLSLFIFRSLGQKYDYINEENIGNCYENNSYRTEKNNNNHQSDSGNSYGAKDAGRSHTTSGHQNNIHTGGISHNVKGQDYSNRENSEWSNFMGLMRWLFAFGVVYAAAVYGAVIFRLFFTSSQTIINNTNIEGDSHSCCTMHFVDPNKRRDAVQDDKWQLN